MFQGGGLEEERAGDCGGPEGAVGAEERVGGEGGGPLNDENQRAPAEEAPDGFIFEMDSEEKEGRRNFPTLELDTSIVAPHSRRVTPLQATSASSVMIPEQHPHQAHSKLKLNTHLHHQVNIPSPSTISLKLG